MLLFVFSSFTVFAVTYSDDVPIEDNCGNKITLRVVRTLTNVSGECGLVKCEVNNTPLNNSGQYIDEYDNMVWDNGNSIAEIYSFSQPVYFFYQNNGIYGIDFSVDVVTFCGTFSLVFTPPEYQNAITVLGCSEDACTSSFSYCDFYLDPEPDGWVGQMPMLESVSYIDPVSGAQTLDASNNNDGFQFPYYGRVAIDCGYHPNLFDFVNDMNGYLIQSGIGGACEFYYTELPNYCKRYVRYMNTGVFFYEMDILDKNFYYEPGPIPVCTPLPGQKNNTVFVSPDFPISYDCLPGTVVNDATDVDEILSNIDKLSVSKSTDLDKSRESEIHCYPNIVIDDFTIYNKTGNKYKVDIYTLSGQLVKEIDLHDKLIRLNVSDYKQGMYFVRMYNIDTGITKIEKIIRQ
ncbi:MAG TPA: T9SS type A sorting domain-containing protein [Bacteroidetes bacterium]|nr:T9SS type A sorting domain-containing protein [Bacteroidota bacterium]